jgi:hypothetical protein
MLVSLDDGQCRRCGGQLEIKDASDSTLSVLCTVCDESYSVEVDAFNDGGMSYWPQAMAEFSEQSGREEEDGPECDAP